MGLLDPIATRALRQEMVRTQLRGRGIRDERILAAMSHLPRELFIPPTMVDYAYMDSPLPIGQGQTISQPYMVAVMAELLQLQGGETVLEVGAGSGYSAAILALLATRVIAVERLPSLLQSAKQRWSTLGLNNIVGMTGDGSLGYLPHAPYAAICVTAAAPAIPQPLLDQLTPHGGRLVIPVGSLHQQILYRVSRQEPNPPKIEPQFSCLFVPLIGEEGWSSPSSP